MSTKVLRTKIIPPPKHKRLLARPRILNTLEQARDYRLTILQAEAGYGKSTALAELAHISRNLSWYQLNTEDNDSIVFLLHLCHAILRTYPDMPELPLHFLENWDGSQGPLPWQDIIDQVINALSSNLDAPMLLVLDDAHNVTGDRDIPLILDRLIGMAPAHLHVLLSGRPLIDLPSLSRWRIQGELLFLDQSLLTFTNEEIESLFAVQYGMELSNDEVLALGEYTEGWAIALQLFWQSIRNQSPTSVDLPEQTPPGSQEVLFEMLTHEVFECQPLDVKAFLTITATLRELVPEDCDALRLAGDHTVTDSGSMLSYLRRQDLFVVETAGGVLRYHNIFHNFLRQQASEEQRCLWHQQAASYFHKKGEPENAIYHLVEAESWNEVADLLDRHSTELLSSGRLDTLANYLNALPPETLHLHPQLTFSLGELARLHSRFEESLGWYQQAEMAWKERGQQDGVARALRGQARVYLDTVNPSKAESLLEEAIRLTDGFQDRESQVRLYELLAENKLNSGHAADAESLLQKAESLRIEGPSNDQLWFRVLIRTGRLNEARRELEISSEDEKHNPVKTPRAHRETQLILSLIYSFMGLGKEAYQAALEGTTRGDKLKSPFITAVGHMRQGHALMLINSSLSLFDGYSKAREQFTRSIEIGKSLVVQRLLVEANWGLCRANGYQGNLVAAQTNAQEAIEIASKAGDEWIASLTRLTMGAGLSLAARYEAAESWLNQAVLGFQECSDPFGVAASRMWLCLCAHHQNNPALLERMLPEVLLLCKKHDYSFLWTRPTLLGGPDERLFVPLLILARQQEWETTYVNQLLDEIGLKDVLFHPGYRLSIETLGCFQAWRGTFPIPAKGWQREKSRLLLQILVTKRGNPLDRDQIYEFLWPGLDPQSAQRNFKIVLNNLYQVLEPDREPGSDSAFIIREGSTYSLRPHADIWLDSEEFIQAVHHAGRDDLVLFEKAISLYKGPYLPETLYEDWAAEEREYLAAQFLESADRLTELYLNKARYPEVIDLCTRILAQDNCWERAYRHLMIAYEKLGDRGQVGRTYQRCVQILQSELSVNPAPETSDLFAKLTS